MKFSCWSSDGEISPRRSRSSSRSRVRAFSAARFLMIAEIVALLTILIYDAPDEARPAI